MKWQEMEALVMVTGAEGVADGAVGKYSVSAAILFSIRLTSWAVACGLPGSGREAVSLYGLMWQLE